MNTLHCNQHPGKGPGELGGITILATLILLVLLTIAAMGMSRNSFREVIISGSSRQASMARNAADSGVEFSILWMKPPSELQATGTSSAQLQALAGDLVKQKQLAGLPHNLDGSAYLGTNSSTPPADLQVPPGSGNGFNLSLTNMGKLAATDYSQSTGSTNTGFIRAIGIGGQGAPDLWALRADGVVTAGTMTFTQSKEAWISTAVR